MTQEKAGATLIEDYQAVSRLNKLEIVSPKVSLWQRILDWFDRAAKQASINSQRGEVAPNG